MQQETTGLQEREVGGESCREKGSLWEYVAARPYQERRKAARIVQRQWSGLGEMLLLWAIWFLLSWSPDTEIECGRSRKQKQELGVYPAGIPLHLRVERDKRYEAGHPSATAGVHGAVKPLTSGLGTLGEQG